MLREETDPLCAVPCSKCGGPAIRLPVSESLEEWFEATVAGATTMADCIYLQPLA